MPVPARTRATILEEIHDELDRGTGALITGDIGVGKSHLVATITRDRIDDHVELLIGSPAIQGIPFAASAHLVPDRAISDPLRLLQLARKTLEQRAGGRPLIIVIDDLDQIDSGTMALVHQMATSRAAAVLATVRSTEASTPEITALWKDDHVLRLELPPLTRREQDDLISAAASTALSGPIRERIWELARGNPLFTREILLAIETNRSLDGADSIGDSLLESSRLHDRISRRLGGLSPEERAIVASVALTEPIDADVVRRLFSPETIATAEQRDLVRTDRAEDLLVYRTAHPLFGELVRKDLSTETRDQLLVAIVTALQESGEVDTARDFRIASWLLAAGIRVEPALAGQAALGALRVFDAESAVLLAAAALTGERDRTGLVTYGTALSQVGQVAESEEAFVEASELANGDVELAAVTVARSVNLIHRGGLVEQGVTLLHRRASEVVDPIARADIESMLMQGEGIDGDFSRALRVGPGLAAEAQGGGIPELRVLVSVCVARVVTGDLKNAEAEIERGLVVGEELADTHPIEADQMMLNKLLFMLTKPDIDAGLTLVLDHIAGSSGAGEAPWLYLASWLLSAAGRLDHAERAALAGVELLEAVDPIGLLPLAMGAQAMVQAQSGQIDSAESTLARIHADPRSGQLRSRMFLARTQAWTTALTRGPRAGAEIAAHQGAELAGQSHQTWGAWVAYDAIRLGHGDLALGFLADLAGTSGDGAVLLFAAHARAQVDRDAAALDVVARRWEAGGAWAHAAEAHAHAAVVSSSDTGSARHAQRAIVIREQCDGLSSPVLNELESPLSARQTELARRAATGQSSRVIADELFLSRRTVDNHLGSVYSLLGLAGRADLSEIFGGTQSVADMYSPAL